MTRFGYTLMTEQSGPKELVRYAISAERAGFDFEVSSDHYFPWLASQGHAPYAWSVRTVDLLRAAGKDVTFISPPGENHLFSDAAWRSGVAARMLAFFDKYVKASK